MFCVDLSINLFVKCVACLTVFANCIVKQFTIYLGVVVILLLNVMELFSVVEGALLDRPCMGVCCDPSVHLDYPSICLVCVCQKLSHHLRVESWNTDIFSPYVVSLCDYAYYVDL